MKVRSTLTLPSVLALLGGALLNSATAQATQSLEFFIQRARSTSFDAREQKETLKQRSFEKDATLGRLLPGVTAQGIYTFNQYEAAIPAGTFPGQTEAGVIVPQNQLDGILRVDVPLINLANFSRYGQAKHLLAASEAQKDVVDAELDQAVARAYYIFVGATALVEAANRSLKIANENLDFVAARQGLGAATTLDLERARTSVEQSRRDQTDANLVVIRAARNLETISGVTPTPVEAYHIDDLHKEAPLSTWLEGRNAPQDRVQEHLGLAAESAEDAASRALLPSLSANAQERITNATGFTGQVATFQLQAMLTWNLDYTTYANSKAQASAAQVQKIQAERISRGVEDAIFDAYHRVEAGIAKSASARAQAAAALKASELSLERYKAGAVTQLDVTQSQRDSFQAQAASIQSDADLAFARILLRLASGKPPVVPESTLPPLPANSFTADVPPPSTTSAAPPASTPAAPNPSNPSTP